MEIRAAVNVLNGYECPSLILNMYKKYIYVYFYSY